MRSSVWSRIDPVDLVVAVGFTLALQAEIWFHMALGAEDVTQDRLALSITSLAISLPLAFRRTLPWTVAIISLGAEVAQEVLSTPTEGLANLLAMLLVCYSLGRYARPPAGYAGILLVAVVSFGVGQDLADNLFVLVVLGAAWLAGLLVGRRTDDLDALELRRLAASRAGAEEERLRIARELHDVVAHRVSMIVVQSQLAETVLDEDPDRALRAMRAVEEAGRDALRELRSVLGLLHHDDPARLSPGDVDLARVGDLVDETRRGGLPVTFEASGATRAVPPAVALAAFRIVQESLTNVVRHASAAPTRVRLVYEPTAIEVVVQNEGEVLTELRAGHGLAGMGERAAFVGGSLSVDPAPSGGLRVHAVLPTPEVQP